VNSIDGDKRSTSANDDDQYYAVVVERPSRTTIIIALARRRSHRHVVGSPLHAALLGRSSETDFMTRLSWLRDDDHV